MLSRIHMDNKQPKLAEGKIYAEAEIDVAEKWLNYKLPQPLRELVLWMFEESPDIRSEFVSMLNYTLGDVVPERPELEFKRKEYSEDNAKEGQEQEDS